MNFHRSPIVKRNALLFLLLISLSVVWGTINLINREIYGSPLTPNTVKDAAFSSEVSFYQNQNITKIIPSYPYLYVLDKDKGFIVYTLHGSDSSLSYNIISVPSVHDLVISGIYLYLIGDTGLHVYSLEDRQNPIQVFFSEEIRGIKLQVSHNLLVVQENSSCLTTYYLKPKALFSNSDSSLFPYDLQIVCSIGDNSSSGIVSWFMKFPYLFIGDQEKGILIYELSENNSFSLLSYVSLEDDCPLSLSLFQNCLFVGLKEGGFAQLNLEDYSRPFISYKYNKTESVLGFSFFSSIGYFLGKNTVYVFDLEQSQPLLISSHNNHSIARFYYITRDDVKLYIAAGKDGLFSFDLSDPVNPFSEVMVDLSEEHEENQNLTLYSAEIISRGSEFYSVQYNYTSHSLTFKKIFDYPYKDEKVIKVVKYGSYFITYSNLSRICLFESLETSTELSRSSDNSKENSTSFGIVSEIVLPFSFSLEDMKISNNFLVVLGRASVPSLLENETTESFMENDTTSETDIELFYNETTNSTSSSEDFENSSIETTSTTNTTSDSSIEDTSSTMSQDESNPSTTETDDIPDENTTNWTLLSSFDSNSSSFLNVISTPSLKALKKELVGNVQFPSIFLIFDISPLFELVFIKGLLMDSFILDYTLLYPTLFCITNISLFLVSLGSEDSSSAILPSDNNNDAESLVYSLIPSLTFSFSLSKIYYASSQFFIVAQDSRSLVMFNMTLFNRAAPLYITPSIFKSYSIISLSFDSPIASLVFTQNFVLVSLENGLFTYIEKKGLSLYYPRAFFLMANDRIISMVLIEDSVLCLSDSGSLFVLKFLQTGKDDDDDDGISFIEERWNINSSPNKPNFLTDVLFAPLVHIVLFIAICLMFAGLLLYRYYRIPIQEIDEQFHT